MKKKDYKEALRQSAYASAYMPAIMGAMGGGLTGLMAGMAFDAPLIGAGVGALGGGIIGGGGGLFLGTPVDYVAHEAAKRNPNAYRDKLKKDIEKGRRPRTYEPSAFKSWSDDFLSDGSEKYELNYEKENKK